MNSFTPQPPETSGEETHKLRQRYEELLVKLMRLQGETDQITDVEIRERFSTLRDNILRWIQGIYRHIRQSRPGWSFGDVIQRRPHNRQLFPESPSWMKWLGKHHDIICMYVVGSGVIWNCLERTIFKGLSCDVRHPSFPIGLSGTTIGLFKEIMEVIKATSGEESSANRWRSTTMKAFVQTTSAKLNRDKQMRHITGILNESLKDWFEIPEGSNLLSESLPKLQKNVIEPALDLYQDITCSRHQYALEFPALPRGTPPCKVDSMQCDLRNLADWTHITSEDDIKGVFRCLFPSLHRLGNGKMQTVLVVKPLILVYDELSPDGPESYPSGSDDSESDSENDNSGPEDSESEFQNSDSELGCSNLKTNNSRVELDDNAPGPMNTLAHGRVSSSRAVRQPPPTSFSKYLQHGERSISGSRSEPADREDQKKRHSTTRHSGKKAQAALQRASTTPVSSRHIRHTGIRDNLSRRDSSRHIEYDSRHRFNQRR